MILSGNKLGMFEPQNKIWRDSGKKKKLSSIQQMSCQNQLKPFYGIGEFNSKTENYNKTLFRFPLRIKPSEISKKVYSPDKLMALLETLQSEAKYLLLFLRSIESIEVHKISESSGHPSLVYKVEVARENKSQLRMDRKQFCNEIDSVYGHRKTFGIDKCIHVESEFTVKVITSHGLVDSSKWVTCNWAGSSYDSIKEIAEEVHTFPIVGAALEISETTVASGGGRLFCFLPLPPETKTKLPVHINGAFSLSDDRRGLKWPGQERKDDSGAIWNYLIVNEILPKCYLQLLIRAQKSLDKEAFYEAIPCVKLVRGTKMEGILMKLFRGLFENYACFYSLLEKWVTIEEAIFISQESDVGEIVSKYMIERSYNLVLLPENIWEAIAYTNKKEALKLLDPSLVRWVLERDMSKRYKHFSHTQKIQLLEYCLSDSSFSNLEGVCLVPLKDGTFVSFQRSDWHFPLYLCTKEYPASLLPCAQNCLVSVSESSQLQKFLYNIALSRRTQLRLLDGNSVAYLIRHQCIPSHLSSKEEISFGELQMTDDWIKFFWKWLEKSQNSLKLFENLHLVPYEDNSQYLKLIKLRRGSGVVFVEKNLNNFHILNILRKLKVKAVLQKLMPYVSHRDIFEYYQPFSCEGVLKAIEEANPSHTSSFCVQVTSQQATAMQYFIANVPNNLGHVVSRLPIFHMVTNEVYPKAIHPGVSVMEPQGNTLPLSCLPSNFSLISRTSNIQPVVGVCKEVKFPLSLVELIQNFVFPLISSGNFTPHERIKPFMVEVFKIFDNLDSQTLLPNSFPSSVRKLPFLPVNENSSELKCPEDLFNPLNNDLTDLYEGENVFPLFPFNQKKYEVHLYRCGLQQNVSAQDIYLILNKLAKPPDLHEVSKQTLQRVKNVFKFLGRQKVLLKNMVFTEGSVISIAAPLEDAIKDLVLRRCLLPIESQKSPGYPSMLIWKGSSCSSHLTKLNKSVILLNSSEIEKTPNILGSELFVVHCPNALCRVLQVNSPVKAVINHFMKIIENKRDIAKSQITRLAIQTYQFLVDNIEEFVNMPTSTYPDLRNTKWVWIERIHQFVTPEQVAFSMHDSFNEQISPYIYVLPETYQDFEDLMIKFGAHEAVTDDLLLLLLHKINNDNETQEHRKWRIVNGVLNWVTDNGKTHAEDKIDTDQLLVPIANETSGMRLKKAQQVTYNDVKFLKKILKKSKKSLVFIHENVEHLAKYLGVMPLSEKLHISEDVFEDVGQSEPLVTRLKNILRDYSCGLTIIKELLQNADDAEATEVNICYDVRRHPQNPDDLIFPGMSKAHGPAIVVHNNKTFSDDDFVNIQKLAGATKQNQSLKIGKFGVGFCSVYHITDVPSFVSREFLYIFDPMVKYLRDEISDRLKPGKKVRFTNCVVKLSEQMSPFKHLNGFKPEEAFNGTMFRLPLRTQPSEISDKCYTSKDIRILVKDIVKNGPELLLFLTNLKSITFSEIDDSKSKQLCCIEKKVVCQLSGGGEFVKTTVSSDYSQREPQFWLVVNKSEESKFVSSVACALNQVKKGKYAPCAISGEVFCFLPLHLKTGLSVHVSANFAVMNDRRGIHSSDSAAKSEEVQFNLKLMSSTVPQSYFTLLVLLRDLYTKGIVVDYQFFQLWPLQDSLRNVNPWQNFIQPLYQLIMNESLCYSANVNKWLTARQAKFLSPDILYNRLYKHVKEVAEIMKVPVIELPVQYLSCLAVDEIGEEKFLKLFFDNVTKIPFNIRNFVLLSLVLAYAVKETDELRSWILNHDCIPCTPDGKITKKCQEVVDPLSKKVSSVFDPEDHVFPISLFTKSQARACLLEFGMITDWLPWHMIIERAITIEKMYLGGNEIKALTRVKQILQCIDDNLKEKRRICSDELPQLQSIPFLPVLQKPPGVPNKFDWAGAGKGLLNSKMLLREDGYGWKLRNVVGSQKCIVSQVSPQNGGCGRIAVSVANGLQITTKPDVHDVLRHLVHISTVFSLSRNKAKLKDYVSEVCQDIYKYLDASTSLNGDVINSYFYGCQKLLWNGENFIHPKDVALTWNFNGPYLYRVPFLIKGKPSLIGKLNFNKIFETDQLLKALSEIKSKFGENPISVECKAVVKCIAEVMATSEDNSGSKLMATSEDNSGSELNGLFYDENCIMRHVQNLTYNDAPWCKLKTTENCYFVHSDFSREVARKVRIKFIRSKTLDDYDTSSDHFDGVPFGQHEELTQRISNILETYVCNETVLLELLQNADDAKATKLYFILDERRHGNSRLPSDEWKDLQGPALLVWNDQGFSEEDLAGIQKLGLGGKRSNSEAIGQYGIGFNVVYHLTDCPSLLTNNGSTLCIFDPHCRYVPGATPVKPGRRLDNVDKEFWGNYLNLSGAYLQQGTPNFPEEVKFTGSLFRFPLRSTSELVQKSKIVKEGSCPLHAYKVREQLKEWAPQMKEALLFLKHVMEIVIGVIPADRGRKFEILHKYNAKLDNKGIRNRSIFQKKAKAFNTKEGCQSPIIVNYSMTITDEKPIFQENSWLIQQGVGDIHNPNQHWEFLPHIHPMHGIAAQISGNIFKPKVFCFLPLPLPSSLPVHINANFILDSSSRSSLWRSRSSSEPDDRKKWNDKLVEALGSSYAKLLNDCKEYFFGSRVSEILKGGNAVDNFQRYYKLFPKWLHEPGSYSVSEMLDLAKQTYHCLYSQNYAIFAVSFPSFCESIHCRKHEPETHSAQITWEPGRNEDPSKQVYFWRFSRSNDGILTTLKSIGLRITVAPIKIKQHFDDLSYIIPLATRDTVFDYYSKHSKQASTTGTFPCKIEDSKFESATIFKSFVKYLTEALHQQSDDISQFPRSPVGMPLLLTADGYIRCFGAKCISSSFSRLFPKVQNLFLHSDFLDLRLDRNYFLKPHEDNEPLIIPILDCTLPTCLRRAWKVSIHNSGLSLKLIENYWKCFSRDRVFSKHIIKIVQTWAIILSNSGELFKSSPSQEHLMPLSCPANEENMTSEIISLQLRKTVFDVLSLKEMPNTHRIVESPHRYCPSLSCPTAVLKNLQHFCDSKMIMFSDEEINVLFSYFRFIDFSKDSDSLSIIKSLPLFKTINGKFSRATGEVFLWPHNINSCGINKILKESEAVFLISNGAWTKLCNAGLLGIKNLHFFDFYTDFVFPKFHVLCDEERFSQLHHIKDNLYVKATHNTGTVKLSAERFIDNLKKLPVFEKNGYYQPVSQFCDPSSKIFKYYPDAFIFPPAKFHDNSWLEFLRELGLQVIPLPGQFFELILGVAKINLKVEDLKCLSESLLECLFENTDWHKDGEFLQKVSTVHFVNQDSVSKLSWIVKKSNLNVSYVQHQDECIELVSLKGSATKSCAELVWTVQPVVDLPKVAAYMRPQERKNLYSKLSLCHEPGETEIVENLVNISKSRFSHFQLFEKYQPNCKPNGNQSGLLAVVAHNLKKLSATVDVRKSLVDLACIPVSSKQGCSDFSQLVLVKPTQVLSTSDISPEAHPFLHVLPEKLNSELSVLRHIGVNSEIKLGNILDALCCIQKEVIMPIDLNTVVTVKFLLKKLYSLMDSISKWDTSSTLYLPDIERHLLPSNKLLYDDKGYHKKVEYFGLHHQGYSMFSLIYEEKCEVLDKYGFDMKSFVLKLPQSHAPLLFSKATVSEITEVCREERDSKFVIMLKKALSLTDFAEIMGKMLKSENRGGITDTESVDKLVKCLKNCLSSLEIVTVTNLTVNIMLTVSGTSSKFGKANMDFFMEKKGNQFLLYVDSNTYALRYKVLESLSEYILSFVTKGSPLEPSLICISSKHFETLLKVDNLDDVGQILLDLGINTSKMKFQRDTDYAITPKIGEIIPDVWHHRLYADLLNSFKPQEMVGYEQREDVFIFARVEYRLNQVSRINSEQQSEMDMYVISINDSDDDAECKKTVPVIDLYKILVIKESQDANSSAEIEVYDPESESVRCWDFTKYPKLIDICRAICDELRRIARITDQDLRRKCLKAMYLKWHPDKNNHPLASKAFQFLKRQIDRMKNGLDLEDPESVEVETSGIGSHASSNAWFPQWDTLSSRRRASSWTGSQRSRRNTNEESSSESIKVYPDSAKANVWLEQAEYDMKVLEANFEQCRIDPKFSAHVCFLSHQVAEKSLKAGMYAKNGLRPDSLKSHDLLSHANALEQINYNAHGLVAAATLLQQHDCYLKTRYPNRFGSVHKVPSNEYTQQQAEDTFQAGKAIFEIVNTMF